MRRILPVNLLVRPGSKLREPMALLIMYADPPKKVSAVIRGLTPVFATYTIKVILLLIAHSLASQTQEKIARLIERFRRICMPRQHSFTHLRAGAIAIGANALGALAVGAFAIGTFI